jgi:hypothetical protein
MFVDVEKCDIHSGTVGSLPADVYITKIDGESNAIVWLDSNNMLLVIFAHADQEELQKIAEKVEKREIK